MRESHIRNDITIESYNKNATLYLKKTPQEYTAAHALLVDWIDKALALVPLGGEVLEIGSAMPRDARYMRSKGYQVTCSDAAPAFVKNLRSQGENAFQLNILKDPILNKYDMIFANAVMPHFSKNETRAILKKFYDALNPGGVIAFNLKQGEGGHWINEKMTDKRYTYYWQPSDLYSLINDSKFKIVFERDGIIGDLPHHIWIHIIAQK